LGEHPKLNYQTRGGKRQHKRIVGHWIRENIELSQARKNLKEVPSSKLEKERTDKFRMRKRESIIVQNTLKLSRKGKKKKQKGKAAREKKSHSQDAYKKLTGVQLHWGDGNYLKR